MGMGPLTGRGAGFCADYAGPGFINPIPGRGVGSWRCRGRGLGIGMGWRHGWVNQSFPVATEPVSYVPVDELSELKNQARYFGDALQSINSRINKLESEKK